jgi:dihydrofolate reductase
MICGIVAVCNNGGIGYRNKMPWPFLQKDMAHFKKLTHNNVVIMGSNTWLSLGKKLSNRVNIVVSKTNWPGSDHTYLTPQDAITSADFLYPNKDIYIIGGQMIYESCLNFTDKFYVTEIDENYQCDKFFDMGLIRKKFNTCTEIELVPASENTPK